MESEPKLPPLPEPRHPRVVRQGSVHFCPKCNSTMTRVGFLGIWGKLKCDNEYCKS